MSLFQTDVPKYLSDVNHSIGRLKTVIFFPNLLAVCVSSNKKWSRVTQQLIFFKIFTYNEYNQVIITYHHNDNTVYNERKTYTDIENESQVSKVAVIFDVTNRIKRSCDR